MACLPTYTDPATGITKRYESLFELNAALNPPIIPPSAATAPLVSTEPTIAEVPSTQNVAPIPEADTSPETNSDSPAVTQLRADRVNAHAKADAHQLEWVALMAGTGEDMLRKLNEWFGWSVTALKNASNYLIEMEFPEFSVIIEAEDGLFITLHELIDQKYDAEIENTQEEEQINRFTSMNGGIGGARLRVSSPLAHSLADVAKEQEYIRARSPFDPQIFNRFIRAGNGLFCMGLYEKGIIMLHEAMEVGTGYHELFHGIFDAFLDNKERSMIFREFASRKGTFIDRESGREIKYSNATPLQAEEAMAEEYRDYVMQGTLPQKGSWLNRLFKWLKSFFDAVFNNDPGLRDIHELFRNIDSAKYKNVPFKSPFAHVRLGRAIKVGHMGVKESYTAINALTSAVVQKLFAPENVSGIVEGNFDNLPMQKIYEQIRQEWTAHFNGYMPRQLKNAGKYNKETKNTLDAVWKSIDGDWDKLVGYSKEMLKTRGLTSNQQEDIDRESAETEYATKSPDSYLTDAFSVDGKLSAVGAMKLLLSTIDKAVYVDPKTGLPIPNMQVFVGDPDFDTQYDEATKLPEAVPFGKIYNRIITEVTSFNTLKEKLNKIHQMGLINPTYAKLHARFFGNSTTLNINQWYLRIIGFNTFSKQHVPALAQFIKEDGSTYIGDLNQFRTTQQASDDWIGRMKLDAGTIAEPEGKLFIFDNKQYFLDPTKLAPINNTTDIYPFYSSLGIEFTNEQRLNITGSQRAALFSEGVAIHGVLTSDINSRTGKSNTVVINGKQYKAANQQGDAGLGIKTRLEKVFAIHVKSSDLDPESTHLGVDKKRKQEFVQLNGISKINNDINNSDTRDQLKEKIKRYGQPLLDASMYLREWFSGSNTARDKITLAMIDGQIDEQTDENTPTSKLTLAKRLMQGINLNMNDWFSVLTPADSSTEWLAKLKNLVLYQNTYQGLNAVALEQFHHYYTAERELFLADPRPRMFAKLKGLETYPPLTKEQLAPFLTAFIDKEIASQRKTLMDAGIISYSGFKEKHFTWKSLDGSFAASQKLDLTELSDSQVDDILRYRTANFMVNNIELQMLYFGDIADIKDPTKRYKSFMSPTEASMYGSTEFNDYAGKVHNQVEGIALKKGDPGQLPWNDLLKTVRLMDVVTASRTLKKFIKSVSTDGQAIATLVSYKQMMIRGARWNDGPLEALFQWAIAQDRVMMEEDKVFRYEDHYTPEEADRLREHDRALVKKGKPNNETFNVIKPVTTGESELGDIILDKMSVAPMTYAMVRGSSLATLYTRMLNEDISYAIYGSGRKIGPSAEDSIYDEKGAPNKAAFNPDSIVDINYRWFGIQTETQGYSRSQTIGTQTSAMASMNLMDGGVPISFIEDPNRNFPSRDAAREVWELMDEGEKRKNTEYRLIREEQDYREQMVRAGYKALLDEFGAVDTGSDIVVFEGKKKLYSLLQSELGRRQVSQNLKQGLALDHQDEFESALETLPNYEQIKNILFSYLEKYIAKQKVGGAPHIMQSGSGFEKAGFRERVSATGKTFYTNDSLRFYIDEDGKRNMEVMLPCWFADKLRAHGIKMDDDQLIKHLNTTPEGQKILKGIGFRIPTQDMNSMDSIIVKKFTPSELGQTVVVPEELVTKAGSDFDVDKLNLYLKNIFITTEGQISLIEYKGSKEATDAFYTIEWEKKIKAEKADVDRALKFALKQVNLARAYVTATITTEEHEKYSKLLDKLFGEEDSNEDITLADVAQRARSKYARLLNRENALNDPGTQEKELRKYLDKMYRLSLENAYFDTVIQILELPGNFNSLTTPNNAEDLKAIGGMMVGINSEEFGEGTESSTLSPSFMNANRHNALQAKSGIGIAAVNQKNTAVMQKGEMVIVLKKLQDEDERKWIGNGRVGLPSNTVTIDNTVYSTISGVRDQDITPTNPKGRLITSKVSQYIDGFVDFVKDNFLTKIGLTRANTAIFLFLEKMGVPNSEDLPIITFFMNQPIIREYEKFLNTRRFSNKFSKRNINAIKNQFPVKGTIPIDFPIFSSNEEFAAFLKKPIVDKYGATPAPLDNEFQHFILHEYLKYAVMADNLYRFTQATDFDTAFISNSHELNRKQYRLASLPNNNIFENKMPNNTLSDKDKTGTLLDNTFVGEVARWLKKASDVVHNNIFKIMSPEVKELYQPVIDDFQSRTRMSTSDFVNVCRKIEQSFIIHLLMHTEQSPGVKYNERVRPLLIDAKTSIANRIKDIKKALPGTANSAWNNNLFIKEVSVDNITDRDLGTKIIKFINRLKDPMTSDVYTNALEEIKEKDLDFFNDIMTIGFLQSGIEISPISFMDIFPTADFTAVMAKVFTTLSSNTVVADSFVKNDAFYRMRWKNTDVVGISKVGIPTMFEKYRGTAVEALLKRKNPSADFSGWMTLQVAKDASVAKERIIAYRRDIPGMSPSERASREKRGLKFKETVLLRRVDDSDGKPLLIQTNLSANTQYVTYVPINAWGDGIKGQESYTDGTMSKFDNGSYKVPTEFSNADMVSALLGTQQVVPSPEAVVELAPTVMPTPTQPVVPSSPYKKLTSFTRSSDIRPYQLTQGENAWDVDGHPVTFDGHPNFKSFVTNVEGIGLVWARTDTGEPLYVGDDPDGTIKEGTEILNGMMDDPSNSSLFDGMQVSKNSIVIKPILSTPQQKSVTRTSTIITREELRNNPATLYLFGDNTKRKGLGGQAKEMRGEPNAMGVITKRTPSTDANAYLTDATLEDNKRMITADIDAALAEYQRGFYVDAVIPQIGVGLAELPTRAPQTYAHLQAELNRFEAVVNSLFQTTPSTPSSTIKGHSGGAPGADTDWDVIGAEFGVSFTHYREPGQNRVDSVTLAQKGLKAIPISDELYAEGKAMADRIDAMFGENPNRGSAHYRYRNYAQVKNADAVFAISTGFGQRNGIFAPMDRGTLYAIYGAVLDGKPVYVFDQKENQWFEYQYNAGKDTGFMTTSTPTLTPNFAGVGTRNINDNAKRAIRDVYEKTFGKKATPTAPTQATQQQAPQAPQTPANPNAPRTWARYAKPGEGYEVSTAGDSFGRELSALRAKLRDGRTIEDAYQLDVKGYRDQGGKTWRDGHGKPPVNGITTEQQWEAYKNLWKQYLGENPAFLPHLIQVSAGKVLTDQFSTTDVNQARALAEIINETLATGVAPSVARYKVDKTINRVTLIDGVAHPFFKVNGFMLEKMGYSPQEIGNILKETC